MQLKLKCQLYTSFMVYLFDDESKLLQDLQG